MTKPLSFARHLALLTLLVLGPGLPGAAVEVPPPCWPGQTLISHGELRVSCRSYLDRLRQRWRQIAAVSSVSQANFLFPQLKLQTANSFLGPVIWAQLLRERGLQVSEQEILAALQEGADFADEGDLRAYYQRKQAAYFDDVDLHYFLLAELSRRKLIQSYSAGVVLDEKQLKAKYDADPALFALPEAVEISQILVREKAATIRSGSQAIPEQFDEIQQALSSGMTFEQAVLTYSQDRISRPQQGRLGWIQVREGQRSNPLAAAVLKLAPGQITPRPVRTPLGWHLLKRGNYRKAQPRSYAQVRDAIRRHLLETQANEKIDRRWGEILAQTPYHIDQKLIDGLEPKHLLSRFDPP